MANKTYPGIMTAESKTDDRYIIDVAAPGYAPDDVKVSKKLINDGKNAVLVVKGSYTRPRGRTDKVVPRFALDKTIADSFKLEFPFDKAEYDYAAVAFEMKNGRLRISVPKTAAARGEAIAPIAADANINAVGIDEAVTEEAEG